MAERNIATRPFIEAAAKLAGIAHELRVATSGNPTFRFLDDLYSGFLIT
jgi:hypothetical protein